MTDSRFVESLTNFADGVSPFLNVFLLVPLRYVKQMQLSINSGNHKRMSECLCVCPSPPSSKQKIEVEKKGVGEMFTECMFACRTL